MVAGARNHLAANKSLAFQLDGTGAWFLGGAVRPQPHRLRRVPDHPEAERQHQGEESARDQHVRGAPAGGEDEPGQNVVVENAATTRQP
jgi:hypothetical protein